MFNEKSKFNILKKMAFLLGLDIPYDRMKSICTNKIPIESLSEEKLKNFNDAFNYILMNIKTELSSKLLRRIYFIISGEILDDLLVESVLREYYINVDDSALLKATQLHATILEFDISNKVEFAFLLTNYILVKRGCFPLLMEKKLIQQYKDIVNSKDFSYLYQFFILLENHSKHVMMNVKKNNCCWAIKDVFNHLKSMQNFLIRTYNIKHLLLFGSIVKGTNNQSSDIDILVSFDDTLIKSEKNKKMSDIKKYLIKKFKTNVDIIDFGTVISKLEFCKFEKLITIF